MSALIARAAWVAGAPIRWALLTVILLYRVTIGPLVAGRCRFHPSCSAYAGEAVRVHGALRGSALTLWRLLRCSPVTAGGLDPVPPPKPETSTAGGMTTSYRRAPSMTESYRGTR